MQFRESLRAVKRGYRTPNDPAPACKCNDWAGDCVAEWHSIDVARLRKELCGKDKMPLDFEFGPCNVLIHDVFAKYEPLTSEPANVYLKVTKSHKAAPSENTSKHRIFVLCGCDKWIPIGRLAQHINYSIRRSNAENK